MGCPGTSWGRTSEECLHEEQWGKPRPEEERERKSVFYLGKGRWGSQCLWGPTGHSDLWRCQGHEGQTLVGLDRWKREGQEVSQVKPTEECLHVEEFWRSGSCPLSVIPGPWGLPVREDNRNKQGWPLSTQEVPGCYKEGVLGWRSSKIGDRVGSQFHAPARTLSAQFTCLLTLTPSAPDLNVGCCSLGHFSPVCGWRHWSLRSDWLAHSAIWCPHAGAESSHNRKLDKAGPQPRTGGTTLGAKQVRLATGAQVLQSGGGQCFMGPISLAAGSRCVCALLETLWLPDRILAGFLHCLNAKRFPTAVPFSAFCWGFSSNL